MGVELTTFIILSLASFLGSFITASLGVGGGVFLLLVMLIYLPAIVVIPIHGVIQLASNVGRSALLRQYIEWNFILIFSVAALVGAICAGFIFFSLPAVLLQVIVLIGAIILTWLPAKQVKKPKASGIIFLGFITTFLSMFVGTIGPLLAAYIKGLFNERLRFVSSYAAAMAMQHFWKIIVFGAAGFAFTSYLWLIISMATLGLFGTVAGRFLVLEKFTDERFAFVFKLFITCLVIIGFARLF